MIVGSGPALPARAVADVSTSPGCRITPRWPRYLALTLAGADHVGRASGPRSVRAAAPPRGVTPDAMAAVPAAISTRRGRATSRGTSAAAARSSHVDVRVSRRARSSACFGPNGAGKSTLLGMLVDARRGRRAGDVRYGGRPARELGDALRARIGVLGHDLFLYGDLTARENLAFFGRLYGVRDRRARASTRRSRRARLTDRARRSRRAGSRAACASGWRSSARCCTSRGSCCSTSRSPASTTSRRRCCAARLRDAARARARSS